MQCFDCNEYVHAKCSDITINQRLAGIKKGSTWYCAPCRQLKHTISRNDAVTPTSAITLTYLTPEVTKKIRKPQSQYFPNGHRFPIHSSTPAFSDATNAETTVRPANIHESINEQRQVPQSNERNENAARKLSSHTRACDSTPSSIQKANHIDIETNPIGTPVVSLKTAEACGSANKRLENFSLDWDVTPSGGAIRSSEFLLNFSRLTSRSEERESIMNEQQKVTSTDPVNTEEPRLSGFSKTSIANQTDASFWQLSKNSEADSLTPPGSDPFDTQIVVWSQDKAVESCLSYFGLKIEDEPTSANAGANLANGAEECVTVISCSLVNPPPDNRMPGTACINDPSPNSSNEEKLTQTSQALNAAPTIEVGCELTTVPSFPTYLLYVKTRLNVFTTKKDTVNVGRIASLSTRKTARKFAPAI
ncbi:hypothetical protein QYM36_000023 [Artemia franciscana]|uniref:Uncharacterized protein n=1 Tax=Artemia franciscana TaxID=6661 RepID=A0AA88IDR5_ARTSF|nr:hypothetical protein QYM36_000023 [Artemia franciscana]